MKTMNRTHRAGLLALASALVLAACGQEQQEADGGDRQEGASAREVEVTEIHRQDIPLEKSYPALLRSDDEVTLVARVTGFLEERHFEPGQLVEEGERLYSIEPDLYQASVNQREADLQSAQAELARARRDAERFQRLLSQNSVSQQQVDEALAAQRVAEASVAQAEAALASAEIDLGYAEVKAPVGGMIGLSRVNVGNLVSSGTELATVTPLDPLEVRFQLPQRDAFELRRQLEEDAEVADIRATLVVPALGDSDEGVLEGRLDFLGSRVEEATSTVQASASFANPQAAVLPGQFVRVRLEGLTRYDVLAVPEIAVTQGLMGPQVFVLDEDDKARSRTVELGELAGPWHILRGGLEEGDRVVVGDPSGIEPGTPIDPLDFEGDAEPLVEEAEEARAEEQAEDEEQAEEALDQGGGEDEGDGEDEE
jgi:membrane fusion protein, multidrug efflux system